jgi:hypothetical protein
MPICSAFLLVIAHGFLLDPLMIANVRINVASLAKFKDKKPLNDLELGQLSSRIPRPDSHQPDVMEAVFKLGSCIIVIEVGVKVLRRWM